MTRRVLIVDDHAAFRSGARAVLEAADYEVVGEAADRKTAIEAVGALHPDLVLLDVQLPDGDGFSIAEELGAIADPPGVVLISSREASDYEGRLDQIQVDGFIHKPELSRSKLEGLVGPGG